MKNSKIWFSSKNERFTLQDAYSLCDYQERTGDCGPLTSEEYDDLMSFFKITVDRDLETSVYSNI